MGFLSDEGIKLFLRNDAVLVQIGSFDHFLENSVVSQLSQVLGDFSEILQGDEASSSGIEGDENFVDFFPGFVLGGSGGHHAEEFVKFKLSTAIFIDFCDHVPHSFGFGLDTQGIDGLFEL